jgi:hypothetical protein
MISAEKDRSSDANHENRDPLKTKTYEKELLRLQEEALSRRPNGGVRDAVGIAVYWGYGALLATPPAPHGTAGSRKAAPKPVPKPKKGKAVKRIIQPAQRASTGGHAYEMAPVRRNGRRVKPCVPHECATLHAGLSSWCRTSHRYRCPRLR